MRALKAVDQHMIKHIWEQYAKEYLINHPDCFGKYYNKIHNYYIFKTGTKERKMRVSRANSVRIDSTYSMAGLVMSYEIFRKIIEVYFKKAIGYIVQGEALHINALGKFCMVRAERDFRKTNQLKVDWGKTRKQEQVWNEQKQKFVSPKLIYFTDDDWTRVKWFKNRIKNDSVYEFSPAKSDSDSITGFRGAIKAGFNEDPLRKFNYLFAPIRDVEDIKRKPFKKAQ